MRPSSSTLRRLLAAFTFAASVAWAQPAPPAQAFFRDAAFSDASLSPSGAHVAFLVGDLGQRRRLAVLDLQTMKPTVVGAFKDVDVDDFEWVNERRLVFNTRVQLTGPGRAESGAGLYAANVDGDGFRQLVESVPVFVKSSTGSGLLPWTTFLLSATRVPDSDEVYVINPAEFSVKQLGYIQLRRLNTLTGRVSEVDAPLHAMRWLVDAQGRLRVVETRRDNKVTVQVRQDGGDWKVMDEGDAVLGASISPRWIAPDGTLYAVTRTQGRDTLSVHTMNAGSGELGPAVLAVKGFDVQPEFVADAEKLLGIRFMADAEVTRWLDPRMKSLQATVDALLPNTANRLDVPLRGGSPHLLVKAFSNVQPPLTYLYHTESRKLTRLGSAYPGIDPRRMGQTDFIRVKARDGLEIPT